jgi:hypothetical protein
MHTPRTLVPSSTGSSISGVFELEDSTAEDFFSSTGEDEESFSDEEDNVLEDEEDEVIETAFPSLSHDPCLQE